MTSGRSLSARKQMRGAQIIRAKTTIWRVSTRQHRKPPLRLKISPSPSIKKVIAAPCTSTGRTRERQWILQRRNRISVDRYRDKTTIDELRLSRCILKSSIVCFKPNSLGASAPMWLTLRLPTQHRLACGANFVQAGHASRVRSIEHQLWIFFDFFGNRLHGFDKKIELFFRLA